jgi:putative membrane protein
MRSGLATLAKGFLMGAADVVPGVSGGTMAFILGIYRRLLEAIRSVDLTLLGMLRRGRLVEAARHVDLVFLLWLGAGIVAALAFFTRVVPLPKLIHTHPELVYGLFFGLIAASIVVLFRSLQGRRAADLLWLAGGAGAGLGLVTLVPVSTPDTAWFVFLSGAVAISAMILPGISGSFILLILRKYAYVFDAIGHLKIAVIIPFGLGIVTGLMVFSRALVWLLGHSYRQTVTAIIGLLIGSLWLIWPFQERVYETVRGKDRLVRSQPLWPDALDATVAGSVGLAVLGLVLVLVVSRLAASRDRRSGKP